MPISGLVITLVGEEHELLADVVADGRMTLGERQGAHLPAVLSTRTAEESEATIEALFAREGVRFVDVVTVDFSDVEDTQPDGSR